MTLADIIRERGPIPTVRVSSAQARGRAKQYSYWGATRYELRLTRDGRVSNHPLERATSDRRSYRLAYLDALYIAGREGRLLVDPIGVIGPAEEERVMRALGLQEVAR